MTAPPRPRTSRDGRFRTFRGAVEIPLAVRAEGPLLIKGPAAALPDRPDAAFVRYPIPDLPGPVPYVPGSSLKGVLRSGSEALLRALGRPVCNPLDTRTPCKDQTGCADRCDACFTFGSVKGASVLLIDDGLPWRPDEPLAVRAERVAAVERQFTARTSVAINRQTGAAEHQRLFDYEALVGATFYPTLRLRNPDHGQAALVATALGLLDDGTLRLGSQTTRGFGRVRVTPEAVIVRSLAGDWLRELVEVGGFAAAEPDGILTGRRSPDPVATLQRWRSALRDWLPPGPR
jgi:CRISPR/Cas system CSM-associated protein Csm3 (group 7 of RAMP superfamily)